MEYKIDVIIPVYNSLKYIGKALDSINKQTARDLINVTIVDDAGVDDYRHILTKYKSLKINYIKLNKHLGPGGARQVALAKTDCPYVMFLDSDDLFLRDDAVEIMLNYMKSDNVKITMAMEVIDGDEVYHLGNLHAKIYERQVIKNNKIKFPNIFYGEDTVFNMQYILSLDVEEINAVSDVIYSWQKVNSNSLTETYKYEFDFNKILKKVSKKLKRNINSKFGGLYLEYLMLSIDNKYEFVNNYEDSILYIKKYLWFYNMFKKEISNNKKLDRLKLVKEIKLYRRNW